jgi:hypothetical protein
MYRCWIYVTIKHSVYTQRFIISNLQSYMFRLYDTAINMFHIYCYVVY